MPADPTYYSKHDGVAVVLKTRCKSEQIRSRKWYRKLVRRRSPTGGAHQAILRCASRGRSDVANARSVAYRSPVTGPSPVMHPLSRLSDLHQVIAGVSDSTTAVRQSIDFSTICDAADHQILDDHPYCDCHAHGLVRDKLERKQSHSLVPLSAPRSTRLTAARRPTTLSSCGG